MNICDGDEVKKILKADLAKLGAAAARYEGGERVDALRAYLRLYLEPYLRGLKEKGMIKNFLIGISPVFFYYPKLRVYLKSGQLIELPLNGAYRLGAAGLLKLGEK